ncbi:RHS repeat protein, partial [Escherichia coli]|nr:RHS repeat protein [Escherichia coli]
GAAGPDRIVRNLYNSAREVTTIQTAYGTADQANEVARTYTNNGKLASVTDGEGNRTSYEYDGFDRLSKTSYPVTTAGSGTSSGSDYEQLGYDAASNVTSRRLRDGQVITYGYDNLNRVTSKVTPGSAPNWDVTYSYDLLG